MNIRQGDLLFVPVEEIPEHRTKQDDPVLRHGESTGHSHKLAVAEDAELFVGWRGGWNLYVKVGPNGVSVVHEEHHVVQLPANQTFKVHVAREYDYLAGLTRQVRD